MLPKNSGSFTLQAQSLMESFQISRESGFLIEPSDALPSAYAPWEDMAENLTTLLSIGALRRAVLKLPVIDVNALLHDSALLSRAKLLLTTICQGYVFGDTSTTQSLPPQLAKPLCRISKALDVPPILSYSDYVLANWQRIDPTGPLTLDNLRVRIGIHGSTDEAWFMLVHIAIEAGSGEIARQCVEAKLAADARDAESLRGTLDQLTERLTQVKSIFLRMRERCDPSVYFLRVRPFTHGWYNNPAFDGGIVYEGVEEYAGRPMAFRGETGAQSSIVPSVDTVLGIEHPKDALLEHLIAMRDYMPRLHREFLAWLDDSCVRGFVTSDQDRDAEALVTSYNRCCSALSDFRSVHLEVARDYVYAYRNTKIDSAANSASLGTGGTPPDYLGHHRDATKAALIK